MAALEARPLAEVLSDLEAQIRHHREQGARYAREEAQAGERRSFHAGELERATRVLAGLRDLTVQAGELTARPVPSAPLDVDLGPRSRPRLTRMVKEVVADRAPGVRFGVREITGEVNRRFADHLRRAAREASVSIVLKRMADGGHLRQLRPGRPHHEAVFARA